MTHRRFLLILSFYAVAFTALAVYGGLHGSP